MDDMEVIRWSNCEAVVVVTGWIKCHVRDLADDTVAAIRFNVDDDSSVVIINARGPITTGGTLLIGKEANRPPIQRRKEAKTGILAGPNGTNLAGVPLSKGGDSIGTKDESTPP